MKKQAWMTAAVAITAFGWPLSLKAQDQTPAPTTISIAEVGEVLARVNGEALLTKAAFPSATADRKIDLYQLRLWIERAIDNELVAQKAVALGLDKDPEYLDQIAAVAFQAAWPERRMLVQLYLQTIPEVADAMNRENYRPTAEEIAAHMAQNQDEFARYPDEIRESFAVRQLKSGAIGAGGEALAKWLRQRLSTVTFTIQHSSGSATIEDAVPTEGAAVLLPKIIEIVVKREAKQRGVATSAIKKDLALLTAALSEVVVEADGNSLTLGELPELPGLIAGLDKGGSVSPIVFNAVTNLIMIADAREAGLEKDPEFLAQQVRGAEAVDEHTLDEFLRAPGRHLLVERQHHDAGQAPAAEEQAPVLEAGQHVGAAGREHGARVLGEGDRQGVDGWIGLSGPGVKGLDHELVAAPCQVQLRAVGRDAREAQAVAHLDPGLVELLAVREVYLDERHDRVEAIGLRASLAAPGREAVLARLVHVQAPEARRGAPLEKGHAASRDTSRDK